MRTESFEAYLKRKRQEFGEKFDPSCLEEKFIPYFNSGERIEVEFPWGETKRGTIGITTGWKPSFLLILTKRSLGSSYLLDERTKILKVVKTKAQKKEERPSTDPFTLFWEEK